MNEYRDPCTGKIGCYADFHEPGCAEGRIKAEDAARRLRRGKVPLRQRLRMNKKYRKISKEA